MLPGALVLGSLLLGLIVGRWWVALAPLAFGIWIAATSDVDEVPPWFLGLGIAVIEGIAVLAGVYLRRLVLRSR
jgi:hypothetical protein